MPFNAQGIFMRLFNWRNDRDQGINILAERMDQETDSIVSGINQIVQGQAKFTGTLKSVFGTNNQPSFTFYEDQNTGIYRVAEDTLGISAGGEKRVEVNSQGTVLHGNLQVDWQGANDGAGSGLDADKLDGEQGAFYQNASNLNSGSVPSGRLVGVYENLTAGNANNAASAVSATNAENSNQLSGEGGAFYRNASNLNSGTVSPQRLGGDYSSVRVGTANSADNANMLNNQGGAFYQNASNLNAGTVASGRLSGVYGIDITGDITAANGRLGRLPKRTTNLNNELENGWFMSSGGSYRPPESGTFVFENMFYYESYGRQRGFYVSNRHEYERYKINGRWSSWVRIYTSTEPFYTSPNVVYVESRAFKTERFSQSPRQTDLTELSASITPRRVNSRVRVDVNLCFSCKGRVSILLKREDSYGNSFYVTQNHSTSRILKTCYGDGHWFVPASFSFVNSVSGKVRYTYTLSVSGASQTAYGVNRTYYSDVTSSSNISTITLTEL